MGGLPLVFLVSFMSAQIDDVKDLHANMKWNDPAIDAPILKVATLPPPTSITR